MRLTVKLLGFHGFPEVEKDLVDGVVQLVLPDDATLNDLLRQLAEKYGPIFMQGMLGSGRGLSRVSVFIDHEMLEDPQAPLADKMRLRSVISVSLLRPLRGG